MLSELKCSKATYLDSMPARYIKDAADLVSPGLTYIINLSIEHGRVPNDLKLARVITLYKIELNGVRLK